MTLKHRVRDNAPSPPTPLPERERGGCVGRPRRGLFVAWVLAMCSVAPAMAADSLDLFVTDYLENPAPEQNALVDRPLSYANPHEVTLQTADGKTVRYGSPRRVTVALQQAGNPRRAKLFASSGEYEPFSFLLRPKENLEEVFVRPGALAGPAGTIAADSIALASVEGFHGGGRDVLVPLGKPWNMAAHSTEFFWYTVHVPDRAQPGVYRGEVAVTSKGRPVGSIAVELEVLPIRLEDPPYALGLNYSHPKDPAALDAHLADMRRHGMTTVAPLYDFHLPVQDSDTSQLGDFIERYQRAGFPAPLYFAAPMGLQLSDLAGYGSETDKRWQQKYIRVMRLLHAETQRHGVPVLMSIADELTNKGIEGVQIGRRLSRLVFEELPEIAATSDMNGYREVMAMAPNLNVATFNNGWDGIDHHNDGRQLINVDFLIELRQKSGAIPWFVNADCGRFPFGFFFWKMARYGVRGKVEWYYNLRNERGSLVRTSGTEVFPTLDYERSREGIDDLKYLCKLQKLVEKAKASGRASAARQAAEALLGKIAAGIADDWTAYRQGGQRFDAEGFDLLDPEKAAGMGDFDTVRRALAERIVELQNAMGE
jgi:hypothetical protein